MLDYPEYSVEYHKYRMYANDSYPFIFATLDGEITEKDTGRKGILEVKTTTIQNSLQWDDWNGKIPDSYYIQIIHQLSATGYEFAVLRAYIRHYKNSVLNAAVRDYIIDRQDVSGDIDYLISEEKNFWESLKSNTEPALILPEI